MKPKRYTFREKTGHVHAIRTAISQGKSQRRACSQRGISAPCFMRWEQLMFPNSEERALVAKFKAKCAARPNKP